MFANRGDAVAPCGVPSSLAVHRSSSITPALSHFRMSRRLRLSPTRCSTNFISPSWLMVSKYPRMSASSTQLTFFRSMAVASASSASCCPRPDRPVRETEEVHLIDGVEHLDDGPLDKLVLQ